MPKPVTNEEISQRLHGYARDNYLFLGNVIKGVALATATLILLQIISDIRSEWMKITPWLTSFIGIVLTYMTWGRGVLVTNSRANILDSVLPLLMGIAEFLLFAILYKDKDHSDLWLNWLAFLGVHALVGAAIIHNRLHMINASVDFEDVDLGNKLVSWLHRDRIGASGLAASSLMLWCILRFCVYHWSPKACGIIQFSLSVLFMLLFCKITYDADRQRVEIDEHVSNALKQKAEIDRIRAHTHFRTEDHQVT